MTFPITIDGRPVEALPGQTVLTAARALGIEIPTLCYLERCGPLNSCLVCLVKINGKLLPACGTQVQPGMTVESETAEVHQARRTALELLFSNHVGDCLSPCQRLCPLGLDIPVFLRQLQSGRLDQALATLRESLPLAEVLGRLCHHPCEQGCRRGACDSPAAIRQLERFTTEHAPAPPLLEKPRPSGKTVLIIGTGPTGLAAAWDLARHGHAVTLVDRHQQAGGSLRAVPEPELPPALLERELTQLRQLGVEFKFGVELGNQVTVEGLCRGTDALLIAVGEGGLRNAAQLGLPLAGKALKTDPNTCQTPLTKVFAAGAAVKPVKQLVRALSEGRAAAACVHAFLTGQPVRRPEKPFSSVLGRLSSGELQHFLQAASPEGRQAAGNLTPPHAVAEAARCLHCDCRAEGQCALQHYAQRYGADPNRFRLERRPFEQQCQPGGVIFEPGKCILCGICVKITEQAREPLGLTFIGRGFEVRLSAPLNHTLSEGLQKTAEECIEHCPTGALTRRG